MRRRTENKPRKRMSAEDRRKAILETTVSFISQFGFWGFTIRDVAQAQNITEAGLLYYFKSKEQLLEETLKYADRTNQIAIAEHLGVQGVTGEVLDDGIAYHCDLGLKAISTGTVETNADRPEMVRLYTLLESEALSKDHPVHEYFEQREINLLKEYAFAAERDGVGPYPKSRRTNGSGRLLSTRLSFFTSRDKTIPLPLAARNRTRNYILYF